MSRRPRREGKPTTASASQIHRLVVMASDPDCDPQTASWHLDKRLPVALITALLVQAFSSLWWAASFSARTETRLDSAERRMALYDELVTRQTEAQYSLAQQQAVSTTTLQALVALTAKIDARVEQLYRPPVNGR